MIFAKYFVKLASENSSKRSVIIYIFLNFQGTIGSLDYPPEERKKLAKKSGNFACADCGTGGCIIDLLKGKEAGDTEEVSSSTAEEAKEIIKTMSLKVCNVSQCSKTVVTCLHK